MHANEAISDDEIRALFATVIDVPIAIAVSGGADSMALMHLAQRALAMVAPPKCTPHPERPRLIVLTVDHGLRSDSADDAAWVAGQAAEAGLPCRILTWRGDKPAHGIQAAARAARYRLIHDALTEEACPYEERMRRLLTAHHSGDQAETLLMRLARGSGIDGLSGMRCDEELSLDATPEQPLRATLQLHRPFLDLPKSRLIATLKAAGLDWREDPSNDRDDFERVRIRKALAVLSELGIGSDAIARSAGRLSRARSAILLQASTAIDRAVAWHDGAFGSISLADFNDAPEEIAIRMLTHLIGAFSGTAPEPRLSEIEALTLRIRSTTDRAWPTRAATLGGCRVDWRPGAALRVWREAGRAALPTARISPGATAIWDRRFEITIAPGLDTAVDVRALGAAGWTTLKYQHTELSELRLPPGAAATLPSCWVGDHLLAAPGLPAPQSPFIDAKFLHGDDRNVQ